VQAVRQLLPDEATLLARFQFADRFQQFAAAFDAADDPEKPAVISGYRELLTDRDFHAWLTQMTNSAEGDKAFGELLLRVAIISLDSARGSPWLRETTEAFLVNAEACLGPKAREVRFYSFLREFQETSDEDAATALLRTATWFVGSAEFCGWLAAFAETIVRDAPRRGSLDMWGRILGRLHKALGIEVCAEPALSPTIKASGDAFRRMAPAEAVTVLFANFVSALLFHAVWDSEEDYVFTAHQHLLDSTAWLPWLERMMSRTLDHDDTIKLQNVLARHSVTGDRAIKGTIDLLARVNRFPPSK
jgi:hypothetical protein